jgi:hypothetical protein
LKQIRPTNPARHRRSQAVDEWRRRRGRDVQVADARNLTGETPQRGRYDTLDHYGNLALASTAHSNDHGRPSLPDALQDELVSVRLVYLHLRAVGSATVEWLVADLDLTRPPIYDARDTLQDHDLLTVVSDPEDGRRHRYALNADDPPPTQLDSTETQIDERDPRNYGREPPKH